MRTRAIPAEKPATEMTLTDAAFDLGWLYQRTHAAMLTGALEGRRDGHGRWVVTKASVERMKRRIRATAEATLAVLDRR